MGKKQRRNQQSMCPWTSKKCTKFFAFPHPSRRNNRTFLQIAWSKHASVVSYAIVLLDDKHVEVIATRIAAYLFSKLMHSETTNGAHAFVGARAIWFVPNQAKISELTLRATNASQETNLFAIYGQPTSSGHSGHSQSLFYIVDINRYRGNVTCLDPGNGPTGKLSSFTSYQV